MTKVDSVIYALTDLLVLAIYMGEWPQLIPDHLRLSGHKMWQLKGTLRAHSNGEKTEDNSIIMQAPQLHFAVTQICISFHSEN